MSKKSLSLVLASLFLGIVLGYLPSLYHKVQARNLAAFAEEQGCATLPPEFMKESPAPGAKALLCVMTGTLIVII